MTYYNITVNKEILHHLFSSNDKGARMLLFSYFNLIR